MTTYSEIMIEIKDLQAQADEAWKVERPAALSQARSLVKDFMITPKELYAGAKRYQVPVKYRSQSGDTWTGRGKMPNWLRKAVESGIPLETFKV